MNQHDDDSRFRHESKASSKYDSVIGSQKIVWMLINSEKGSIVKTEFRPKIRVTCFEDDYYEKEWLADEKYLHTIKYGYADSADVKGR